MAATATHAILPGSLDLGEALLVGDALCFASTEHVDHPPLRAIQAHSRLFAWEDRRLLAVWDPNEGCFTQPLPAGAQKEPVTLRSQCLEARCGAEAATSCEQLGMQSSCVEETGMMSEPLLIQSAARTMQHSVQEAVAVSQELLCQGPNEEDGSAREAMVKAQQSVRTNAMNAAREAWNATRTVSLQCTALEVRTLLDERAPRLATLIASQLPEWRDGHAFSQQMATWIDALAGHANGTLGMGAADVAVSLVSGSAILLEQLQTMDEPAAAQLELEQLCLEI